LAMTKVSIALVAFSFAFLVCDGAFLALSKGQHLGVEEPKEKEGDAKKDDAKKSECPAVAPLKEELKELKCNELECDSEPLLAKLQEIAAELDKCEQEKAEATGEKATAKHEANWTAGDIQKPGFANSASIAEPEEEEENEDGLGAYASCRGRDRIKAEIDNMDMKKTAVNVNVGESFRRRSWSSQRRPSSAGNRRQRLRGTTHTRRPTKDGKMASKDPPLRIHQATTLAMRR